MITRHERESDVFFKQIEEITDIFLNLPRVYRESSFKHKGKLLSKLVEKVVINENREVTLEYKAPFCHFVTPKLLKVNKTNDPQEVRKRHVLLPEGDRKQNSSTSHLP